MKSTGAKATTSDRIDGYVGLFLFLALIAAHQLVGAAAAVKVVGASLMLMGVAWCWRGRIPFGIEDRPPMGEISGVAARLLGMVAFLVGVGVLIYSMRVACAMGWAELGACARIT